MHIAAEKLLREVKKAQEELERKQEELKRGQEELKRGQDGSMRVQGQMNDTMNDILAIGKKTAHRSDYSSFRGSRSRLEYAPHSEPALPDQRRTILLRYVHVF
jgi:adenine specific DNA methylase Mod